MRSFWKIAVLVLCVALICAAAIAWQSYKAHANQAKLAEDARTRSKRAEQGDATAQAELANIYYQGQGVPQNYGEALRWYRKAADQGNGEGQFGVGAIYYHGQGVQQDYTEALRWYRKAADQGYAKAQYNLGYMYWYGQGLPQNRAEAVNWFRKAADQGDLYALRALSRQPSTFTKSVLLGELLGGIWLVYFVSFTAQVSATSPRNARQKAIAALGFLLLLQAGLLWYGYAHYMIRSPGYGASAFTLIRWLLNVALVLLLVYIIRLGKRSGAQREVN